MLKLLSLCSVTIAALSAIDAHAADSPAQPTPVAEVTAKKGCAEISLTTEAEIAKYLGNSFYVKKDTTESGTRLKFTGYVFKSKDLDCSKFIHLDLEHSNESHPGMYALHIWRSNVLDANGIITENSDQCANKSKSCNASNPDCVKLEDQSNVFGESDTARSNFSNESGVVRLKEQSCELTPEHPDYIHVTAELPKKFGGPIDYKSAADIAKKRKEDKIKADQALVVSSCEDAKKSGTMEDADAAIEIFATVRGQKELLNNKKLASSLYLNAFESTLKEAKSIDELKNYIASIPRFYNDKDHKYLRELMLRPLIDLVLKAGDKGRELLPEVKSDKEALRIYKEVIEASIAAARDLDPSNQGLRLAHAQAKLTRFQAAADSGSDGVYNQSLQNEFGQTYNRIANWAGANPRDPEVARIFKQYNDEAMGRTLLAKLPNSQYPTPVGYGSGLDQRFVTHYLDREFQAYRESMRSWGNPQAGMNVDGRAPSNSSLSQGQGSQF